MKRMLSLFVLVLAALVAMPETVSAQWNSGQDYGYGRSARRSSSRIGSRAGYRYGYYSRTEIEQLLALPGILTACDSSVLQGSGSGCHSIERTADALEEHRRMHADRNEILGTIHAHQEKHDGREVKVSHFRPYDETNRRLGTVEAGALGAGGGALAGCVSTRNMRNRTAANAICAGATAGGAIVSGLIASRNAHDSCIELRTASTSTLLSSAPVSVPSGVQAVVPTPPSAPKGINLRNDSSDDAAVYDGEVFVTTLAAGGIYPVGSPKVGYRAIVSGLNERGESATYELAKRLEGRTTLVFSNEAQVLSTN